MDSTQDAKQLIQQAKNICIIPSKEDKSEGIACSLALFYTLKNLGKNVNLIIDDLPEKFNFLIPSLDFISYPKNFVISIPNKAADISQVYYEKNDENLKIKLTLNKGSVRKENISFYFAEPEPDLVITVGVKNFQQQLTDQLNSYGFLLNSQILNIDNQNDNKVFGKMNLVFNTSISETIWDIIETASQNMENKNALTCLLLGLIIYTDNFTNKNTTSNIFQKAGVLISKGAEHQKIIENLKSF